LEAAGRGVFFRESTNPEKKMKATIKHGRMREFRVSYDVMGGHVWRDLPAIADRLTEGVHSDRQPEGESDEAFLERVADAVRLAFLTQAGEATGADSFGFGATFAD
jgi:hypothetical protein